MLCIRRWSDAGSAGRVRCLRQVRCRDPKTGQQKVQLYWEDDPLCPSSDLGIPIIYPCCVCRERQQEPAAVPGTEQCQQCRGKRAHDAATARHRIRAPPARLAKRRRSFRTHEGKESRHTHCAFFRHVNVSRRPMRSAGYRYGLTKKWRRSFRTYSGW